MSDHRCPDCKSGYHAPFERFEQVGAIVSGPVFLQRCVNCGTLWEEDLRAAREISQEQAKITFPDADI